MNIKSYTTKTGKKGYILKGAYLGIDKLTGMDARTTVRGRTKKEVMFKYQQKINEFEENGCTTKKRASIKTFNELIDAWLIYYIKTVKKGSYGDTISVVNKYIRPYFGEYNIDNMTPAFLQNKINEFINDVSGKRQDYKYILAIVKRMFKYALSLDLINENPMERTLIHSVKTEKIKKQIEYYDKDELNLFLDKLNHLSFDEWKSSLVSTYLKLLVFSGMRSREALALEWSDIDFNNQTIAINKTLNKYDKLEQTPKTKKSIRTIEIDSETLNALNQYRQVQTQKAWALGFNPSSVVFFNLLARKYYSYRFMLSAYKKICIEINIPHLGLHGLRHTHATMYVNANIDYKTLSERLGHESISMTMDTYAHILPENKRSSLDHVIKFISNS